MRRISIIIALKILNIIGGGIMIIGLGFGLVGGWLLGVPCHWLEGKQKPPE